MTQRGGAPDPRRANGNARNKLRLEVASHGGACQICGQPIDYTLPPGHPACFELDEIVPVSKGGDPLNPHNVGPAHRRCNQWRSNEELVDAQRCVRAGLGPLITRSCRQALKRLKAMLTPKDAWATAQRW